MELKALNDQVIIQVEEMDRISRGGIIIPDTKKVKPSRGTVVSVGRGHLNKDGTYRPIELEVGQRVVFGRYDGKNHTVDDIEYKVIKEDQVIGLILEA